MIDIHCHILPGVDDGSPSTQVSLYMAQLAADSGVTTIVATPHCRCPGRGEGNLVDDELEQRFRQLRGDIIRARIPIELLPGHEVLCAEDTPALFRERKLLTLAGSRYMLVEFYFDETAEYMSDLLEQLAAEGVVPVVAHPERYGAVQSDPSLPARWFRQGYVLQLNSGSILGTLGRGPRVTAQRMLEHGLAHVVASDAHNIDLRSPALDDVRDYLELSCAVGYASLLLEENPALIIRDQPLVAAD